MFNLKNKDLLVFGLDAFGQAAARLGRNCGARVVMLDRAEGPWGPALAAMEALGIEIQLGRKSLPSQPFDLAVLSPQFPRQSHLVYAAAQRATPLISELEFGFQHVRALTIAICGQAGKSTTACLIERILRAARRSVTVAGDASLPLSSVALNGGAPDFLVVKVTAAELEHTRYFRPAIAVLLNLAPDLRSAHRPDHLRTAIGLFINQQPFDWTIIQSEALGQLRNLKLPIPGRIVTFSAEARAADLYLADSWICSRIPRWVGPLIDLALLDQGTGALLENFMAALALSYVLHIPLARTVPIIQQFEAAPHCAEWIAEIDGVGFINDAKSANLRALHRALAALPAPGNGQPNIWLIAGGHEEGAQYHDLKPIVSQRVKGAFLLGTSGLKMSAAWGPFTPCRPAVSLLEAISRAAATADAGDFVLFSPGCSNSEVFRDFAEGGETFRKAVLDRKKTRLDLIADTAVAADADSCLNARRRFNKRMQAPNLYSPLTERSQVSPDYP